MVIVDFTFPGIFNVIECGCLQGCGEVEILGDLINCPGTCPNPPPGEFCQIHYDGVPQGFTSVVNTQVPNGTQVTCGCAPDPQVCPLPPPPKDLLCANLQNTDCVAAPAGECLPRAVLVDFTLPGIFDVIQCECIVGCGEVEILGDLIRCPNQCPIPGDLCQIHFDGVPQGITSVVNTAVPSGTVVTCDCDKDPPVVCQPSADLLGCDPFACPDPTEQCQPRCVRDDGFGVYTVEDCACRGPTACHLVFNTGVPPFCDGDCPAGETCVQTISFDPLTGEKIICCDCEPIEVCGPTPDKQACEPVTCPVPSEECVAKCVRLELDGTFSVIQCECQSPNDCHLELDPAVGPMCVGTCPQGQTCVQTVFTNPDGTVDFCCDCVDDPPACEPTLDLQDCKPFVCPTPGDECRPRCIREDLAQGTFSVLDCDCRPFADCHAEFVPGIGALCQGDCPPGYICVENRIDNGDGTVDICCDCVRRPCKCPGDINGDLLVNGLDIQGFVNCFLGNPLPVDNCTCADMNEDGVVNAFDVPLFVQRILLCEPCFPAACPPENLLLALGTGVDDNGNLIPFGADDDDWDVTGEPPPLGTLPRPAKVISANPAWLTIPGTRWISANATGPNGDYTYEFCFCLDARFTNPNLTIQLRADDKASVFLNGNPIGATPPTFAFNTPVPTTINVTDPNLFVVGNNCITVVVSNTNGVVTGLNLAGTMSAVDGRCCCDEADLDSNLDSGVDAAGGLIAIGTDDDDWDVTVDAAGGTVPRPATVITPHPAWLTIPGTRWISANAIGPNGLYVYELCFCLDPRFENAVLTLDLRADDFATVWLNGVQIGATPPSYSFNTPQPTHIFVTNQDLFVCGKNCIEIKVTNSHGVVTGVNVSAQITADKGLCCCAPSPDGSECCPRECPDPTEVCRPRCVRSVDIGGTTVFTVEDCTCGDPNACHVEFGAGPPICVGTCLPGESCIQTTVLNPDGSTTICCDCEPDPPLGACCLPDGSCGITNSIGCQAHGGVYLGDGTICLGTEACCLPDGTCVSVDAACCGPLYGGTPQGAGSVCLGDGDGNGIDDACQDPPQQLSCCDDLTGACFDLAPGETSCQPGQTLVIGPCGPPEACCLPTGGCVDVSVPCCLAMGGAPQGPGSSCLAANCPTPICGANQANTACKQVECPNPDEQCVPRCITIDLPTAQIVSLDCNCQKQDMCFVDVPPQPAVTADCVNVCPPGMICDRTETDNGDGTITICCDCIQPPPTGSCCDSMGACIPEPAGGCPPNTTFQPDPCDPPQGCCLPDDTCIDLDPQCCQALGGVVTAALCTGTVQGCCLPDGSCVDLDRECCLARGGQVQPTVCQPAEACCFEPPFAPLCIDTDPQCCLAAGGTPQGAGTFCLGDSDGNGIDDACDDPPPGLCPLPEPPLVQHCKGLQSSDCPAGAPQGEECLPSLVIIGGAGQAYVVQQCSCFFPNGCGPVNIVGTILSCPGICLPGENCQLFIDGQPSGLGSIDATTLQAGTTVTCGCGP
ncbi:MAG: dockerin type I domain-containing protein [Phycisphaerae bacterium]